MRINPFRIPTALIIIAIVSVVLTACGGSDTAVVAPEATVAPPVAAVKSTELAEPAKSEESKVSVPAPADTPADTAADTPADTAADTQADTNELASIELKPVDDPATAQVLQTEAGPEPELTQEKTEAALLTSYSDYGFSLKLDLGANIQTTGWTEPEPSLVQGIIAFSYGGVNTNLVWGPPEDRTALTFLADTYNILRASQPSVTFESISDGDISISDQDGVYGGFKAVDDSGTSIGGGLIGAWICGDSETAFRMTLTGEDATVVQLRFDRLLENFACSSS